MGRLIQKPNLIWAFWVSLPDTVLQTHFQLLHNLSIQLKLQIILYLLYYIIFGNGIKYHAYSLFVVCIEPLLAFSSTIFVGGSDIERQISPRGLWPVNVSVYMYLCTTLCSLFLSFMFVSVCLYSREYERHQSYLIYVYHGAAITCKINEEEMSEKEGNSTKHSMLNAFTPW